METTHTSREAHRRIRPAAPSLRAQVRAFIRDRGDNGATDQEIQDALGMSPQTECPRRKELQQGEEIMDSGRKRKTRAGRSAIVWMIRPSEPVQRTLF